MADINISMQQRNPSNTGWDLLQPETKASNVRMADWATSGETVQTMMAKKADHASAASAFTVGVTTVDPNITKESLILTSHANCPTNEGANDYWYIESHFYVNKSTDSYSQTAKPYSGLPRMATRNLYNGIWQPWIHLTGTSTQGGILTDVVKGNPNSLYGVAQLRNVIFSTASPFQAGSPGEIWIKYK